MSETKEEVVAVSTSPIRTVMRSTEVSEHVEIVEAGATTDGVQLRIRRGAGGLLVTVARVQLTSAQAMALAGLLMSAALSPQAAATDAASGPETAKAAAGGDAT